jgi:hypothetical protein
MVDHAEPFTQLLTQGMVLKDGAVMSKSVGNVVDPDAMMDKYGADALRLYVMFVAPPEKEVEWSDSSLEGSFRFLARVWRIIDHWCETVGGEGLATPQQSSLKPAERALRRKTHDTIRRVTADIEQRQQLNTAVSALMELVNDLYAFSEQTVTGGPGHRGDEDVEHAGDMERAETIGVVREAIESLVLMLSPFAPHTAEELWCTLGYQEGTDRRELAVVRSRGGQGRGDHRARAGEREGARSPDRSCLNVGGRARSAGTGRSGREGAYCREDGAEGRRRERPPGLNRRSMKWHRDMRAALILTLALVSSSCGYALAGRGSFLPDYIRVVGIPPIENRSTYQQVELVLTEKIRTEFIGRGKYTVVSEASGSDACSPVRSSGSRRSRSASTKASWRRGTCSS